MPLPRRLDLILRPTPIHRLPRLSDELGIDLWIKRDDLTGFALGGNKGRKLEFLMADALAQEAQAVVGAGAAQSNFIRQLGAACAMLGLRCAAAVMHLPYFAAAGRPKGEGLSEDGGNLALDRLLGVDLRMHPDGDWVELERHAEELAREYEAQGLNVYRVPVGGSSPLSAYAFCEAAGEAKEQAGEFDALVTPSSSGATHAGLAYFHHGSSTRVIGVCADDDPKGELVEDVDKLCSELDSLTGDNRRIGAADLEMRLEWVGAGYSIPSASGNGAIAYLARAEGIFLDPVYGGKAFAGLLDMARSGDLKGRVLYWHTGGAPTLFATDLSDSFGS